MRRSTTMRILLICLAVGFTLTSCGGGDGGGGSSGTNLTSFTSADQAASSSALVGGVFQLSSTLGQAVDLASGSVPTGYAPRKSKTAGTDKIKNVDPRLKDAVDKMMNQLQIPAVKSALVKAQAAKNRPLAPVSDGGPCSGGGSFTVNGTNSSVPGSYDEYTIDISLTACKDSSTLPYTEITGQMHLYHKVMLDGSSETAEMTITNLTAKAYDSGSALTTIVMNGTFKDNDNVTDGSTYADGSFSISDASSNIVLNFSKVNNVWTTSTDASGTTDVDTINGSFSFTITSGAQSQSLNISVTNLQDKLFTDTVTGDKDEWINGTVSIDFTPDEVGCVEGTFAMSTASATPVHTPSISSCPTSGTFTINNATIEFGKPDGTKVTATVNGAQKIFNDCTELDSGGVCS
jgi:hypothetical protein